MFNKKVLEVVPVKVSPLQGQPEPLEVDFATKLVQHGQQVKAQSRPVPVVAPKRADQPEPGTQIGS